MIQDGFNKQGLMHYNIEDELKKLEKIRKDVLKQIDIKQKRGGH